MQLPKYLTTVTTFSKILAMILFIALPILGFKLGMSYQKNINVTDTTSIIPTSIPIHKDALAEIVSSIRSVPQEWKGATITTTILASDLIQVNAEHPELGPDNGKTEYWTNNRTGTWQLLGSFSHGQEGWGRCDDWEKLKVAKGMECTRFENGSNNFHSHVSF